MSFGDIFREVRKKRKDSKKNDTTVDIEDIEKETPAPTQKEAANERIIETTKDMGEYYNDCHKYVYHVFATQWLLQKGLYYEINKLQIGYDIEEKAIIIPIDKNHYEKYSIKE